MKTVIIEGIALQQYASGEQDRRVLVFTREYGVLWILARGIRKINSKRRNLVSPLVKSSLQLYQNRFGFHLQQGEIIYAPVNIYQDVLALTRTIELVEILSKILPENLPEPQVFDLLDLLLHRVDEKTKESYRYFLVFKCKLLQLLGFAPQLDCCTLCGSKKMQDMYLVMENGALLCVDCQQKQKYLLFLPATFLHLWQSLANNTGSDFLRLEHDESIWNALNEKVNIYFQYILESNIQSSKIIKMMER
ncbi:MAG: DNA repair protein RecO [Clostridia bacterium]